LESKVPLHDPSVGLPQDTANISPETDTHVRFRSASGAARARAWKCLAVDRLRMSWTMVTMIMCLCTAMGRGCLPAGERRAPCENRWHLAIQPRSKRVDGGCLMHCSFEPLPICLSDILGSPHSLAYASCRQDIVHHLHPASQPPASACHLRPAVDFQQQQSSSRDAIPQLGRVVRMQKQPCPGLAYDDLI